jgi:hypothetical protein
MAKSKALAPALVDSRILSIRGEAVILDADLTADLPRSRSQSVTLKRGQNVKYRPLGLHGAWGNHGSLGAPRTHRNARQAEPADRIRTQRRAMTSRVAYAHSKEGRPKACPQRPGLARPIVIKMDSCLGEDLRGQNTGLMGTEQCSSTY